MPRNPGFMPGIHAGEMLQGILTESATENIPPRPQGQGKGEKVG